MFVRVRQLGTLSSLAVWIAPCITASFVGAISVAVAADSKHAQINGKEYQVVHADLKTEQVRLFFANARGEPYRTLPTLRAEIGTALLAATNAGMYDRGKTRPPVGLLIANGKRIRDINLGNGAGNFYKKPNGVFFVDHGQAGILESGEFAKRYPIEKTAVADATQSGPMLLINGAPRSDLPPTPNIRSAVGVASPTEIYFVLSVSEVSFLELATMMKDSLNCTDVLYLDGAISNMDTREQPSKAKRDRYAGIIGIVELAANR